MKDIIPIFDSLTHPTLTGSWLQSANNASFELLNKSCKENTISNAFAVGIFGVESYEHEEFISQCNTYKELVPIAGFNVHTSQLEDEIARIKELGFTGIKLHPRFGSFNLEEDKERIIQTLNLCHQYNLLVLLCTYMSTSIEHYPTADPYWSLVEILKRAPSTRVVLLHGGVTRPLLFAELVRFNSNLLLDFSYTMMKYRGSSVEKDIRYLFKTFDRRICIGSDHPEFSQKDFRDCAEFYATDIAIDKKENIFYKNLTNFVNSK